jgi:hypothetical protein
MIAVITNHDLNECADGKIDMDEQEKKESHHQGCVVGIKLLKKPKNFLELDRSLWTLPATSAMSMA